jgi:cell division protein FtsN
MAPELTVQLGGATLTLRRVDLGWYRVVADPIEKTDETAKEFCAKLIANGLTFCRVRFERN